MTLYTLSETPVNISLAHYKTQQLALSSDPLHTDRINQKVSKAMEYLSKNKVHLSLPIGTRVVIPVGVYKDRENNLLLGFTTRLKGKLFYVIIK